MANNCPLLNWWINTVLSQYWKYSSEMSSEMFRFYNGLSPPLMNNIIKLRVENLGRVSSPIVKNVSHKGYGNKEE